VLGCAQRHGRYTLPFRCIRARTRRNCTLLCCTPRSAESRTHGEQHTTHTPTRKKVLSQELKASAPATIVTNLLDFLCEHFMSSTAARMCAMVAIEGAVPHAVLHHKNSRQILSLTFLAISLAIFSTSTLDAELSPMLSAIVPNVVPRSPMFACL